MGLFNKSQSQTTTSGLTSDQVALQRAGKKEVLKVHIPRDVRETALSNT